MRLITNPRPYNTNIETDIVTVKSQPINHQINDSEQSMVEQSDPQFLEGKFVCFAPTHHSAVIMGSTVQNNNRNQTRDVFDASKSAYRLGKNQVRTSVDMALTNGEVTNRAQYIKALALLNIAVKQSLFNTHRSNSIFTGAYGNTLAEKAIRQRIVIITEALNTLQNLQDAGAGIELKPLNH